MGRKGCLWFGLFIIAIGVVATGKTVLVNPGDGIQAAIDGASAGDTVLLNAGVYEIDTTLVVNKALTLAGSGASVRGADVGALSVFEVSASDVTIRDLDITWTHVLEDGYAKPETADSLIRVVGTGLSNVQILNNALHVPDQGGAMSTWGARAITVDLNACSGGITINGNTVYNTRNGIVVRYGNTAIITDNTVYNTKGGVMNYTSNQADADNRTVTDNLWGTVHNEWDIVWNSANYDPDYHESVIVLSAENNGAYVVDRRDAAGGHAVGNRSHTFVDVGGTTAVHEANGNMNTPYSTLALGFDAVAAGGTIYLSAGSYEGVVIDKEIHIDGADAGGAIISSGVAYSPTNPAYKTAFRLDAGADGTVIDDVTVFCSVASADYFAVFGRNVDNVVLDNLVVYNTVQGISNWGGDGWQLLNNQIIGTVAAGGGGIGFFIGVRPGTNLTSSNNLLQGNVVGSDASASDYSCPGIVVALDLRYGRYLSLTGSEELAGNRIIGNTITDSGVVNGVGIEMGVIMTGIADALIPDLIDDTLEMIHGNTISGNTVSGEYLGLYLYTVSDTDVSLNVISNCTGAGVAMYDGNLNNVFHYNSITGNAYGFWNETGTPVDASLNWWGDADGPSGEGTGTGDAVSTNVIFSPWLGIDPDGDPGTAGVQLLQPLYIVVAPVGPEPTTENGNTGYLDMAIWGSNDVPGTDTIEVRHGTYDASEPIADGVNMISEIGSAAHTTLDSAVLINAANVLLGKLRQGFTITGPITVGAGIDASTVHINWNDILGIVTNEGENTLDATFNFWGEDGPDTVGFVAIHPILPQNSDTVIGYMDDHNLTPLDAIGLSHLLLGGMNLLRALSVVEMGDVLAGLTEEELEELFEEYGRVAVQRAASMSGGDYEEFVRLLVGFGEVAGGGGGYLGGGGGGTIGDSGLPAFVAGELVPLQLELLDPITGEIVDDAIVTFTICGTAPDGTPTIAAAGMMTFDGDLGAYVYGYDTAGLEPGVYDVYLGTSDGRSRHFQIEVTE